MRTFERTHPWLRFSADFRRAPPTLWIALGECQSKCEHIAGAPLRPDTAKRLYFMYLAKGVLATTAIEGNTLSEEEVLQHLQGKLELPPSREYLAQEIDNIVAGCNSILHDVESGKPRTLSAERIKEFNKIVLNKLALDEGVVSGEIRKHAVGIARYRGAPAEDCDYLLDRLCNWLSGEDFVAPPGMGIVYAILKAVLAHLYLAWVHPFGDGNGRTARLVEFQILISSGVPAPAAHLMSNHYNQTRTEYYRQLDDASRSGGDVLAFITYAVLGFLDGLRSQLNVIREQGWNVAWENYVHDVIGGRTSSGDARRRHLVLDLSRHAEPVPLARLTEVSPRVATAYANKTYRTIIRDVKKLAQMGLLKKEKAGYTASKEVILAFLPPTANRAEKQ